MNLRQLFTLLLTVGFLLVLGVLAKEAWFAKRPSGQIVILVGLDGFRSDYLKKFQPPTLTRLAAEGVTSESMRPCFPSLTFPNLYTLATGLRPENHGIISNSMYDPEFKARFSLGSPAVSEGRWWQGEPVWLTAERQGVKSACMFWPGSEAEIGGARPSDWRSYDGSLSAETRVKTVLEWLGRPPETRPGLITLYFHEVDSAGHHFGPDSSQTADAVKVVDRSLDTLLEGIARLGLQDRVNLVCVADHGMVEISPDRTVVLPELVDMAHVELDFVGAVAGLRLSQGSPAELVERLNTTQGHFKAYLREEMPEAWHFRNHRRIPPVILVAEEGWSIVKRPFRTPEERSNFLKATHGFPPELPSMGATFVAWGPVFKKRTIVPSFENVEVYELVCGALGLKPAPNDGTGSLGKQALD